MSSITKSLRARKPRGPLQPATGTVKVLRPVGAVNDTTGEIAISGKAYYLGLRPDSYYLVGWDVKKGVHVYDLPLDLSSCDCPDQTFRDERPGGCKHRKALQALRSAGKLPTPTPEPDEGAYKPGHSSNIPF